MNAAPMALLLMVLWGCASTPEEDTAPEVIDYSEPGIFAPGTLEDSVVGQTGVALNLQIWYPSVETGGEPIRYDSLWEGASYDGLEAACELPRPVVVFSHGYGGVRWQSAFLTEHLATHGYVVIAPDHTHNTYLDSSSTEFASVTTRRPLDVADSFDWLSLQSTAPDSPLYGCIDPAAGYAVSGHSFGGYTAFAVSGAQVHDPTSDAMLDLSDDRAWAALALAPWNVEGALTPETMETVSSPVMTLSGTRDENTTWAQVTALFEGLVVQPRYLGEFPEAGHSNFSPVACALFVDEDGCGEDYMDEAMFTELVRTAGVVFFESIRGIDGAVEQLPETSEDLIWQTVP